jgi:hypothetical protein
LISDCIDLLPELLIAMAHTPFLPVRGLLHTAVAGY